MGIMEGIVAIISIIALTIIIGVIIICIGVNSKEHVENTKLRADLEKARKKVLDYEYKENRGGKGNEI